MVKKINEAEFSEAEGKAAAVIDFNAVWCGPCRMLGPVLSELSDEYTGKVDFYSVDVDQNQDLAVKYGISSIPALIVLKDGEEAGRQVGFVPKPALKSFIDNAIG